MIIRGKTVSAHLLAAICGFAAALALPYLVPIDAENFAMRSGTFAACLVLFAAFLLVPLFKTTPIAHWLRAACPAFFFAFALSVGTELFTYQAFLPGLGSALRRLLVPLMMTPLLSGILLRLSSIRLPGKPCPPAKWEAPAASCILIILWLPIWLAYWPGMLNYDFSAEYMQHITKSYSLIHPLSHSALMIGIISIGELLVNRTFGVFLMSIFQVLLLDAVLTACCMYLRRRGLSRAIIVPLLLLFGLHPVFSVMAVSMTKDTLFAACLIGLCLQGTILLESSDRFFSKKHHPLSFVLFAAGTALMRVNGLFALIPLLAALLIRISKSHRRRLFCLTAFSLSVPLVIHLSLMALLHPVSMPTFQLYSLPAQQLVRAYNADHLTPDEKASLESWYTSPDGLVLHPHLADPAKGYLDRSRLEQEGSDFLRLWRQAAPAAGREYLEAFLMLNIGSWYPDDLTHTTIYPDVSYNEKGYLQTQEYDMQDLDFHVTSFLPKIKAMYEQICRYNQYVKLPVIPILFSTGIPIWVLVFAFAIRRLRGTPISFAAAVGPIALFLSYLLGPCTLARYIMPLYAISPFFFLLAFSPAPANPAKTAKG